MARSEPRISQKFPVQLHVPDGSGEQEENDCGSVAGSGWVLLPPLTVTVGDVVEVEVIVVPPTVVVTVVAPVDVAISVVTVVVIPVAASVVDEVVLVPAGATQA